MNYCNKCHHSSNLHLRDRGLAVYISSASRKSRDQQDDNISFPKFTFAISSPDEFLLWFSETLKNKYQWARHWQWRDIVEAYSGIRSMSHFAEYQAFDMFIKMTNLLSLICHTHMLVWTEHWVVHETECESSRLCLYYNVHIYGGCLYACFKLHMISL